MTVKQGVFQPLDNNCYLLIDDKTNVSALIDCSEFNAELQNMIGDTELKYILLTHGHYDHIAGLRAAKQAYPDSCVVISGEDAPMLSSPKLSLNIFSSKPQMPVQADRLVADGDVLPLGNISIEVLATPGHTKGSVCYLAGDNLFTGDTLFCGDIGRTDFPGGSSAEMAVSLQRLSKLEGNLRVLPGHEETSALDFERAHNPYLKQYI